MVKIFIEKEDRIINLKAKNPKEVLSKLKINSETVLFSRNNELILENTELKDSDELKLLSVISGG